MTEPLLQATDLSRSFGGYQALFPTHFSLSAGEMVLLAGHNGAGKTTLLNCLSGLIAPSSGSIELEGYELYRDEIEYRRRLAFVADVPRFYTELTAWEHLKFIALAHGVQADFPVRAEKLLKEFDLWEARDLFPHHYSRGMRLKLGLLMALIRPFRVILLDEPASALDSEAAARLFEQLRTARDNGAAVLLSTHQLEQARPHADAVWTMHQGRLECSE